MRPLLRTQARTAPADAFFADVIAGLSLRRKRLPSKYFYDDCGSRLFDAICETPEYYLTRAELAILRAHAGEMAARIGPGRVLVEYGSGSSVKTRLLLARMTAPAAYVPIDVSHDHLLAASRALAADHPGLQVLPLHADFTRPFALPAGATGRSFVYFPGSTIGNFEPEAAAALLRRIAATPGCEGALIGIDLQKSPATLEAAYNDEAGVTAAFNLNLLQRINREIGADFVPGRFVHRARYDAAAGRIEMRLYSTIDQVVHVADHSFQFRAGEAILTELSHKYTVDGFAAMASEAGLQQTAVWTDAAAQFAVVHLSPRAA